MVRAKVNSGSPLIPNQVDFYLWNITNPDEIIIRGQKPKLEQVGPFSYSQVIEARFPKPCSELTVACL